MDKTPRAKENVDMYAQTEDKLVKKMLMRHCTVQGDDADDKLLYMLFDEDPNKSKVETPADSSKKYWGFISDLITGPEHKYTLLKKLLHKF